MSDGVIDLRPDLATWQVMKGDPFSLMCELFQAEPNGSLREDLRDWVIDATFKVAGGSPQPMTVESNQADLEQGTFWVGVDEVTTGFTYAIKVKPPGGLFVTRWRGEVLEPTAGADD